MCIQTNVDDFQTILIYLLNLLLLEEPKRVNYINDLLGLLKLILRVGKAYKILVEEAIKTVTQGILFKSSDDKSIPAMINSSIYVTRKDQFYMTGVHLGSLSAEHIQSFCQDVVGQVPSVARCLLPTVTAISEKIPPNPSTQSFVCSILSLALSAESAVTGDEGACFFLFVYFLIIHPVYW